MPTALPGSHAGILICNLANMTTRVVTAGIGRAYTTVRAFYRVEASRVVTLTESPTVVHVQAC